MSKNKDIAEKVFKTVSTIDYKMAHCKPKRRLKELDKQLKKDCEGKKLHEIDKLRSEHHKAAKILREEYKLHKERIIRNVCEDMGANEDHIREIIGDYDYA